jgi:hypothetical protein
MRTVLLVAAAAIALLSPAAASATPRGDLLEDSYVYVPPEVRERLLAADREVEHQAALRAICGSHGAADAFAEGVLHGFTLGVAERLLSEGVAICESEGQAACPRTFWLGAAVGLTVLVVLAFAWISIRHIDEGFADLGAPRARVVRLRRAW